MHAIEHVLNAEELASIRGLIGRSRFTDGVKSAAGAAQQVKLNQQLECAREDHQKLVQLVFDALRRSAQFSRIALPLEISVPMINRYAIGMTYGAH